MKQARLANKIIRTLFKDSVHYPSKLIVSLFSILARFGVLLLLYWYVFKLKGGEVNGVNFQTIAWSMFFYFVFMIWSLREVARVIAQDIKSGSVEVLFSKPISYLYYRALWQVGAGLYPFLVTLVAGVVVLTLIIGIPQTMVTGVFWLTFFPVVLLSLALTLLLYMLVGLAAFWIEEINPVYWIIDKSVLILGGSYLPVALFPRFLKQIAKYSPFGASQFTTHTVYGYWQTDWYSFLAMQVFWLVLLGIFAYFVFNRAKKRVAVNGG